MPFNIAISSTSGAVLIIGILIRVYGIANNIPSLTDFGTLLSVLGGSVIGIFVFLSIIRNFRAL